MIRTDHLASAALAFALGACSSTSQTAEDRSSHGALELVYVVQASGGG